MRNVVYNEESAKEESEVALERLPDFKVLQAAVSKYPKLFDTNDQMVMELADEGKLELAHFEGSRHFPIILQ